MENVGDSKPPSGGPKQEEDPSNQSVADSAENTGQQDQVETESNLNRPSRTPFTSLSQVDADLALARTLQEQERAYMMLRMNQDGIGYGSWETGIYIDEDDFGDPQDETDVDDEEDDGDDEADEYQEEDAFDVHAHGTDGEDNNLSVDLDPANFSSDEAYARALQEAEEREMAARMMALAGINDHEAEDSDDHGGNSQDTWQEVDPEELSYEELLALGEVVGSESRGLAADKIASLPSVKYKAGSSESGSTDSCVICRLEYEDGEALTVLSCKHLYHPECINNWLKINKVCPVCSTEVSTSGNS